MVREFCLRICTGDVGELRGALIEKGIDETMSGNLARKAGVALRVGAAKHETYGDVAEHVLDILAAGVSPMEGGVSKHIPPRHERMQPDAPKLSPVNDPYFHKLGDPPAATPHERFGEVNSQEDAREEGSK